MTATPEDPDATVEIKNNETIVASGTAATWREGENALIITVTNGGESKIYTVTVTVTKVETM